ncbi:MAG: insulinase family protein, partial [Bdellovibrionales bacterium]|nr:insulinase family protein [Bdellovibrionales bacterium]
MGLRTVSFFFVFLLHTLHLHAATIEVVEVNGFKVHLIDIEQGDEFSIQYSVPVGSRFDPSPLAGRAHFLEHMVGKGSLRYPGYHTKSNLAAEMSAKTNASTGFGNTFYFLIVNKQYLEKSIDLLFAGLAGPEFKTEVLKKELTAVDNEVNVEIPSKPLFNLFYSNVDYLPEGHPYKRWDLGTSEVLDQMTIDDLKNLFYANYQPTYVNVTIAGNFSSSIKKENVVKWLETSLIAPDVKRDPHGFQLTESPMAQKNLPPMFNTEQPAPFIEYKSDDSTNILFHLVESKVERSKMDLLALSLLNKYLNLNVAGSLQRELKDKGWIHSLSVGENNINHRAGQYFVIRLTDEGYKNKELILNALYETYSDIKQNGIDQYVLEILKGLFLDEFKENFKNSFNSMIAMRELFEINDPDLLNLDFEKALDRIQSKDFQKLITQLLDARLTSTSFLNPNVDADQFSTTFKKPFKLYNNIILLEKLNTVLNTPQTKPRFRPIFPKVEVFEQRSTPLSLANTDWYKVRKYESPLLTHIKEDHTNIEGAFYLEVPTTQLRDKKSLIALRIYVSAFLQHIVDTLTILRSRGIYVSIEVSGDKILWKGEGDSQALSEAFNVVTKLFHDYKPENNDLEIIISRFKMQVSQEIASSFMGSLASTYAISEFNQMPSPDESLEIVSSLTASDVLQSVKKIKMNSRPHLFIIGDYTEDNSLSFISSSWNALRFSFPHTDIEKLPTAKPLTQYGSKDIPLPAGKDKNS